MPFPPGPTLRHGTSPTKTTVIAGCQWLSEGDTATGSSRRVQKYIGSGNSALRESTGVFRQQRRIPSGGGRAAFQARRDRGEGRGQSSCRHSQA